MNQALDDAYSCVSLCVHDGLRCTCMNLKHPVKPCMHARFKILNHASKIFCCMHRLVLICRHIPQSVCNTPQCTFFLLLSMTSSHAHHEHLARLKSPATSTVPNYHLLLPCPLSAFLVVQYLPTSSDDSADETFTSSHFRRPSCTSLMCSRGSWLHVSSCNATRPMKFLRREERNEK